MTIFSQQNKREIGRNEWKNIFFQPHREWFNTNVKEVIIMLPFLQKMPEKIKFICKIQLRTNLTQYEKSHKWV